MPDFYVIRCTNKTGELGYIFDSKGGIKFVSGGFHSDITQFKTYVKAQHFLRRSNLERNGIAAYIVSNQTVLKELSEKRLRGEETHGASIATDEMCYLENKKGEKLCYDSKNEEYYFDDVTVGYCVFENEFQCVQFINYHKFINCKIKLIKNT